MNPVNSIKPSIEDLKRIIEILIAAESSYAAVRNACTDLLDFFYRVSEFDDTDFINNQHMQSQAGQAISPLAAAVCIRDFMRTRIFMRGLAEAVSSKLRSGPDKPVTVLYAGTGPFATLLLPLATIFKATQLNMLLLDINPASIACLKKIISYLNLKPYVLQVVQADAAAWRIPAAYKPDIILSETMMPSLKTEPQVSIAANLVSQCPQALLVPEMIEVSVALLSSRMENEKRFIHLKTLLILTKEKAIEIKEQQQAGSSSLTLAELKVPKPAELHYSRLALITRIKVFNKEMLGFNESSLTLPEKIYNLHTVKNWPAVFTLQYHIYPKPGFVIAACTSKDI